MNRGRETFRQRVHVLRDSWSERRQVRGLASAHDFDSQFRLLLMLHDWAGDCVADILDIYGPGFRVTLSPRPLPGDRPPGFSLAIGGAFAVSVLLGERSRAGASHWFISVTMGTAGPSGAPVSAGPQRRTGQWTRGQLEDLVLSALGSYERSISGETSAPNEGAG